MRVHIRRFLREGILVRIRGETWISGDGGLDGGIGRRF